MATPHNTGMTPPQAWNAKNYADHASFVPELGKQLLSLVPSDAQRVLDLGCGDGVLTRELAARHAHVVGVDSSQALVDKARTFGLNVLTMDGQALRFVEEFDVVFSNAALHWMKDADAVLGGVSRALRAGGKFVAELGGRGNMASVRGALTRQLAARGIDAASCDPWYFPSPAEYATRLERAGFRVDAMWYFARPTASPSDITGWLRTFGDSFVHALPEHERGDFLAQIEAELAPVLVDAEGVSILDYVRLRFVATKCQGE